MCVVRSVINVNKFEVRLLPSSHLNVYLYMDDLNRYNIGGCIGGEILNYADDLCLICLSSTGMQKLLNVCSKYATKCGLLYDANKSYSLCFKVITIKFERLTLHFSEISIHNVTNCRFLGRTISVKKKL